ncbi:MAG: PA14 domain-containing protein [Luteolibacter sp.]
MTPRVLPLLFTLSSALTAQDGQQLFTLYCSACHGADGKGATAGTFPPLSGSPWVAGDPDRAVKIVLKGLTGSVDVLGKTYNLEMPPQGAALPDDQVAAILTYVRSAWGNQAAAVTTDFVKSTRTAIEDRKTPWSAPEILKLHPLPLEKTALKNLISQVYSGSWKELPDFSTLKAENVEEEHDGILDISDSPHKDHFAMLWQGQFEAPADGEYKFLLDADDSAKVIINGTPIATVKGIGPLDGSRSKVGKIKLTQGSQPFRVEYLEVVGQQGIALGWQGPGDNQWKWLSKNSPKKTKVRVTIPIEPENGRPVIYRNFIAGTTPRAIGVGFPGGVNLAYSADNLAPELIWTGKFIDGAPKWLERGTDNNPPAGENVVTLTKSRFLPKEARFKGYKLDPAGNPTFSVQIGEQILLDSWKAESGALVRKLTISGSPLEITIPQSPKLTIEGSSGNPTLLLTPGQPVTLTYRWK